MKTPLNFLLLTVLSSALLTVNAYSAEKSSSIVLQSEQSTDLRAAQLRLNAAEAKWRKTQPQHYSYTIQRSCFCAPDYLKPLMIRVFKGKVQQATLLPDNKPLPNERRAEAVPIDRLLKIVQAAINRKAASLQVTYDKKYGYPAQVSIDYDTRMADEELYFSVKDFKVASGLKPAQTK